MGVAPIVVVVLTKEPVLAMEGGLERSVINLVPLELTRMQVTRLAPNVLRILSLACPDLLLVIPVQTGKPPLLGLQPAQDLRTTLMVLVMPMFARKAMTIWRRFVWRMEIAFLD